jgi:hypothetical protein
MSNQFLTFTSSQLLSRPISLSSTDNPPSLSRPALDSRSTSNAQPSRGPCTRHTYSSRRRAEVDLRYNCAAHLPRSAHALRRSLGLRPQSQRVQAKQFRCLWYYRCYYRLATDLRGVTRRASGGDGSVGGRTSGGRTRSGLLRLLDHLNPPSTCLTIPTA